MASFLDNIINGESPQSHRRLVVLVLTANFIVVIWYLLAKSTPVTNKDLISTAMYLMVSIIGAGWVTLSAEKIATKPNTDVSIKQSSGDDTTEVKSSTS
jgi:hypothetical protein